MKRFWAFIAACLFLLLTACGGSTSTTEPVWQAELPNTGITVQVSGCTLEEKTASYWANPGAEGTAVYHGVIRYRQCSAA